MANYYTDHPEIAFHLEHPLMKRIVELKERNYADAKQYDDAPVNYEDAIENYKRILDIAGDITANIIAPNSEAVDQEGPHLIDNRMHYASKTLENIEATRQAGLWGISMPRRYGGLNLPNVVSLCYLNLLPLLMLASRTYGHYNHVLTHSMSSVMRNKDRSISHVSVLVRRCQWTLLSLMQVPISSALC